VGLFYTLGSKVKVTVTLLHNTQLGTLYQQPLVTCLHHHLVSTAVSRLSYLPGLMASTHCSMLVIA